MTRAMADLDQACFGVCGLFHATSHFITSIDATWWRCMCVMFDVMWHCVVKTVTIYYNCS